MTTLIRLALRNLLRHPWRSFATVVGVGIGIAAVLTTLSVGANVRVNVQSALQAAAGKAELLVTPGAGGRAVFEVEPVLEALRETPGVRALYPVLNTRSEPVRDLDIIDRSVIPGVDTGFQLGGRVTSVPDDLPVRITSGELPTENSNGVAIASDFAADRGIAVGDVVSFATPRGAVDLRVSGLLDDGFGLASTNGGRIGVMALTDLQGIMSLAGRVSHIEVMLEDGANVDAVRTALETRLLQFGEAYTVTFPAGSGNIASGIVDTLQAGLSILAVTLLALGGFMAYNTFIASVQERTREYALLRTICLTRRDVQTLALIEAAALSVVGAVFGLIMGIALAYVITRLNAVSLGFEFRKLVIPFRSAALASVVGVLVSLMAGVLPARNASRTPPIAAARLTDEEPQTGRVALGWLLLAGGVVISLLPWSGYLAVAASALAMALFFTGVTLASVSLLRPALVVLAPLLRRAFGAAGHLGANFTQRNAARNGVAIGTVVVGTGLIIGVGSMVAGINSSITSWVDTTVVGDLFVTSPVSFPPDFEAAAAAVPGVGVVSGVGIRVVRYQPDGDGRGRSIALVLVDPARFDPETGFGRFQYIQGEGDDRSGYDALAAGGSVLVSNTMLDRYGVHAGDAMELRTADGFKPFGVAGVVVDFTGGGETAVASIHDMDRFGGGTPDLYVLTAAPGFEATDVKSELQGAFPGLFLDITLNADYRNMIFELTRQSFVTTNMLLLIAVLVAALGVANTLGMNLVSRSHEIAVLRTVGMTRSDVRRLIASEGIVVTLVGAVLGVGFGLLLSRIIVAGAAAVTGFDIDAVVPWSLVLTALIAAPVVGFIASLLPARRAAQLSPTQALGFVE